MVVQNTSYSYYTSYSIFTLQLTPLTRTKQHMRVTISCRYALSFMGRCFCF